MTHSEELIKILEKKADVVRKNIMIIFENSQIGHVGGTMSIVEMVTALYFHHMKLDLNDYDWTDRDRLVISKAHACEAIYAILTEIGWIPKEKLNTYYHFGSPLQGHADRWCTPGIDYSGGSLGQGLSFAAGMALAEKLKVLKKPPSEFAKKYMTRYLTKYNPSYRVYCILGDGECHEGQVWEAAMFATKYKLDNLVAIVDYNKFCIDGPTTEILPVEPFVDKWRAFGWWVTEVDGHDMRQLVEVFDLATKLYGDGKPKCIMAHTVKGYGVTKWEEAHSHYSKGEEVIEGVKEGKIRYG